MASNTHLNGSQNGNPGNGSAPYSRFDNSKRANGRGEPRPLARELAAQSNTRGQKRRRSLEAEQSLLGAVLMDSEVLKVARGFVRTSDFSFKTNAAVWDEIISLDNGRQTVDLVTVAEGLRAKGELEATGGAEYLASLIEACPSSASVADYARVVMQNSVALETAQTLQIAANQLEFYPDARGMYADIHGVSALLDQTAASVKGAQERLQSVQTSARYSDDRALDALVAEISWLWPGFLPRGAMTLLAGRPGVGKSSVALDLFARLIKCAGGEEARWPDGEPIELELPLDQKFLWIDTEAALGIFRQRLNAWNIPRGKFAFNEGRELEPLRVDNDGDWGWIKGAVESTRTPLVVVDSLSYAHEGEENSNDYMKFVMRRLADLASEFNTSVCVIHHLNKLPAGFPDWPPTLDMIRGASAITQFPRSVIGIGKPKAEEADFGFMCIKNNIAALPEPLGYSTTGEGPAWGEAPAIGARTGGEPTARERAAAFLLEFLAGGPKWATTVQAEAEKRGFAERTLDEAKKNLVRSYKIAGKWAWELANKSLERPDAAGEPTN